MELQNLVLENLYNPNDLHTVLANLENMQDLGYEERRSLIPQASMRLFRRRKNTHDINFTEGVDIIRFIQDEKDDLAEAY